MIERTIFQYDISHSLNSLDLHDNTSISTEMLYRALNTFSYYVDLYLYCCVFQERQQKSRLEAEIDHLRQDNVRLQEESQTAAAQLRRFTEWFFNTIDRQ